jgi:hypothetical protein
VISWKIYWKKEMDSAWLSILVFLIITLVYFVFTSASTRTNLLLYGLVVCVSQFLIQSMYLVSKCGGNIGTNFLSAFLITFFPWGLLFGAVLSVLVLYPNLKSLFGNVVGYFVIAGSARNTLTQLLTASAEMEQSIQATSDITLRQQLRTSSEALYHLFGNPSLFINAMTPTNFEERWQVLRPLMRTDLDDTQKNKLKETLASQVLLKDRIGEFMWYIYTGIFISSIVSYKIAQIGCPKGVKELQASQQAYQEKEAQAEAERAKNNSTAMIQ